MDNKNKIIYELAFIAVYTALAIAINSICYFIPGVDFAIFFISIAAIFFKNKVSLLVSISISFLSLFLLSDPIWITSYFLSNLLVWLIIIITKKQILENNVLYYVLCPIFSTFHLLFVLFIWSAFYGWQMGYAMYAAHSFIIHIMFFLYLLLPIITFKRIKQLFVILKEKYEIIFNETYIDYLERNENKDMIPVYTDNKINYNIQLVITALSSILLVNIFTFLPYKLALTFDIYHIALILIIPILMLLVTPTWMKLAKKISNLKVLQINSLFLLIAIISIFTGLSSDNVVILYIFTILGIILFGIFIAGFLPIGMATIRSYNKRNKIKFNPTKLTSLVCFILIPVPFIINQFLSNTWLQIFFDVLAGIIVVLLLFNKNIMSDNNAFNYQQENFKAVFKNKHAMLLTFSQNFFIGFTKFLDYGYLIFFFIYFSQNQNISFNIEQDKLFIFLTCAYLLKFISQALGKQLNYKNINFVNNLAMALIISGFVTIFIYIIISNFIYFKQINLVYKIILLILSVVFGFANSMIERTKMTYYKNVVKEDQIQEMMVIDHSLGNGVYSILISSIFMISIIFIPISFVSLVSLLSILLVASIVTLSINLKLQNKTAL